MNRFLYRNCRILGHVGEFEMISLFLFYGWGHRHTESWVTSAAHRRNRVTPRTQLAGLPVQYSFIGVEWTQHKHRTRVLTHQVHGRHGQSMPVWSSHLNLTIFFHQRSRPGQSTQEKRLRRVRTSESGRLRMNPGPFHTLLGAQTK